MAPVSVMPRPRCSSGGSAIGTRTAPSKRRPLAVIGRPLGVTKIDAGPERSTVQFVTQPPFDAGKLIALVQRDGRVRFAGPDRVRIERGAPLLHERVAMVREFLGKLT